MVKRSVIVALLTCLALPPAAEATTILWESQSTTILTPPDGAIFLVDPSFPFASVSISAQSDVMFSYQAGDAGEKFTYAWEFVVDGAPVASLTDSLVQTAAPREAAIGYMTIPASYWTYTHLFPEGTHSARVAHRVFMENSTIIAIKGDLHMFDVVVTPEPASLVLLGTGLSALVARRARRSRKDREGS